MAINSKVDICNMALGHLGNYGTINNIDTPNNDKERTFTLWYDICRQFVLQLLMPNFATTRVIKAKLSETPLFGYSYYYAYPNNALKILGVSDIKDKENKHTIERTPLGVKAIGHDTDWTTGIPLRIIVDVEDVSSFSPETKMLMSQYLAAYTCLSITQDPVKAKKLKDELPAEISSASAINAQENPPIRKSNSKFRAARYSHNPTFTDKK